MAVWRSAGVRTSAPQLQLFFDALKAGHVPLAVNCSAGQDRTGITSALLLLALGVPRDVVIQDYLFSTRYRRPDVERGNVDLEAAAENNAFAKMMLQYGAGDAEPRARPLLTTAGVPFLRFALDQMEQDYGSVEAYLDKELGVSARDIERLKSRYLVSTFEQG
ncbi:MAG: tyrosine-protein phosphatase [Halieaceae bacterium]|nr:tyrosine-protein phosphatase [Halieaceae bacterium]